MRHECELTKTACSSTLPVVFSAGLWATRDPLADMSTSQSQPYVNCGCYFKHVEGGTVEYHGGQPVASPQLIPVRCRHWIDQEISEQRGNRGSPLFIAQLVKHARHAPCADIGGQCQTRGIADHLAGMETRRA